MVVMSFVILCRFTVHAILDTRDTPRISAPFLLISSSLFLNICSGFLLSYPLPHSSLGLCGVSYRGRKYLGECL